MSRTFRRQTFRIPDILRPDLSEPDLLRPGRFDSCTFCKKAAGLCSVDFTVYTRTCVQFSPSGVCIILYKLYLSGSKSFPYLKRNFFKFT
jgi:hypothetical protein